MRWLERATLRLPRVRRAVVFKDPGFPGPLDPGFEMHPADPGVALRPAVPDFSTAAPEAGRAMVVTTTAVIAGIAAAMRPARPDRPVMPDRVAARRLSRSLRWTR